MYRRMANIYINTKHILKASIGDTNVLDIYIGNKRVWPDLRLLLADTNQISELRINADTKDSKQHTRIGLDS